MPTAAIMLKPVMRTEPMCRMSFVRIIPGWIALAVRREPAKRRPVLEQRLKRLEEFADETATRDAAAALRRKL